jgi:hypothetical protein
LELFSSLGKDFGRAGHDHLQDAGSPCGGAGDLNQTAQGGQAALTDLAAGLAG